MRKQDKIEFIGSIFVGVCALFVAVCSNNYRIIPSKGSNYVLDFENKKISDRTSSFVEEITTPVATNAGNTINVKVSNVVEYQDGWQTILPNGYFYNPIDDSANHNKISGISSIRFDSQSGLSLSLYYGNSINNSEIIYSHKKELSPNVNYSFNEQLPTYFYIKNDNNSNVNIEDFKITYSCLDSGFLRDNLNILMIGNSFADDTLFYSNRIAASYGITLNLYDAYIAGCTIDTHYSNLTNGSKDYSMRSINNGSWVYNDNMSLTEIIESHTWDIITFQQASAEVGRSNKYSNLSSLVNGVRSIVGSTPKFYWHQTWAYDKEYHDYYDYYSYFNNDQIAMYSAINSCYQSEVEPLGVFEKMIPAGTAVQNLRTSYMKDTLSRDGKHMSSVHGRYLLGLNFVSTIYDLDLDMSPCGYVPPEVNDSFKNPAYEAIRNAYQTPLGVTNSQYVTMELGNYDLSEYTVIDAGLVGCSYWNSTDGNNYNIRQSNVSGTSILYASTKRFTSSTLPEGSLVVIGEAFGVRPEAWVDDSAQSNRKSETYQNLIVIDSNFFDGYLYRAFNIFKAGKTTLLGQFNQVFDGFHIYVPNNKMAGLTPKSENPNYAQDKDTFLINSMNMDAYERIHLDPITGFYKCDSYYELTNSYVDDTAKKFVCTRPFYSVNNDLPENTVIIVDNGYQWRSDCWGDHTTYSPRPGNVSTQFTVLNSGFWSGLRRRTFNVSSTSGSYIEQNYIDVMNHMRIYVPVSDDVFIEDPIDKVTMTALGTATMNSMFASFYGKSEIPFLITLSGDDTSHVKVEVDGTDISATGYTYDKQTGNISINTEGSAAGYTYGTITGVVNPNQGTISNVRIDGTLKDFMTNNGSIVCSEAWHDRCDYATREASQAVWQRWYMEGSWIANSGSGDWTIPSGAYKLENRYSMGLRIAPSNYQKTRFTLKEDLNNGQGLAIRGVSLWIYNPNGTIYNSFRIYIYTTPSSIDGDHAFPSTTYQMPYSTSELPSGEWKNIKIGLGGSTTIYNISFYFETNNSSTTYVYLGHVSLY